MRISDWSSDVCSSDLSRMTSTMTANLQNLTHTTFMPIYANWHASCYIDDRYTEWGANLQPTLQKGWSPQPSGPCEPKPFDEAGAKHYRCGSLCILDRPAAPQACHGALGKRRNL